MRDQTKFLSSEVISGSLKELGYWAAKKHGWMRDKEKEALDKFKGFLLEHFSRLGLRVGLEDNVQFKQGGEGSYFIIDLVCKHMVDQIAIEFKFKTDRDGAVPDNRKRAFHDILKCEHYVGSGRYCLAYFLWLTNQAKYLEKPPEYQDSYNFSTHKGRRYDSGTALSANRAPDNISLPLTLKNDYVFNWVSIDAGWHILCIPIEGKCQI
jgi:hypothetical protein